MESEWGSAMEKYRQFAKIARFTFLLILANSRQRAVPAQAARS
jgi:hypothetical protein